MEQSVVRLASAYIVRKMILQIDGKYQVTSGTTYLTESIMRKEPEAKGNRQSRKEKSTANSSGFSGYLGQEYVRWIE
jgi:hypothetical protein